MLLMLGKRVLRLLWGLVGTGAASDGSALAMFTGRNGFLLGVDALARRAAEICSEVVVPGKTPTAFLRVRNPSF
jgi:hypothetical protein